MSADTSTCRFAWQPIVGVLVPMHGARRLGRLGLIQASNPHVLRLDFRAGVQHQLCEAGEAEQAQSPALL